MILVTLLVGLFLWPCLLQAGVVAEALMILDSGLEQPTDVAVHDDGRIYVLDGVNGRVVVFSREGERDFSFSRSGPDELSLPVGISIDGGRVFVADTGNHRIVVFDVRGDFVRNIFLTGEAPPEPVALAVSDGLLWWTDRRNHRLCAYDLRHDVTVLCRGTRGEGREKFHFPFQIASDDSGYLHVTDVLNGRIQVLHPRGRFVYDIGRFGLRPGELFRPNGLAFSPDGLFFLVGDSYAGTITLFRDGQPVGLLSDSTGRRLNFKTPVGMTIRDQRLYVVDAGRNRVEVFRLLAQASTAEKGGEIAARVVPSASRKGCVICHRSWASPPVGEERPGDKTVPAVASPRMCYSCHHGVVVDSRRRIGRGGQHPDVHHRREKVPAETLDEKPDTPRKDKIPAVFPRLADGALSCGSCHTPHGQALEGQTTRHAAHGNPWLRVPNRDGDLCQQCHASKLASRLDAEHPPRGVNHPVGISLQAPPPKTTERRNYASDEHLHRGLPARLEKRGGTLDSQTRMTCQSCHQIHGGEGDAMTLLPVTKAELCIECHPRQHAVDKKDAGKKGVHAVDFKLDEAVTIAGKTFERVTCFTCHSVHSGKPDTPLLREDHRDGKLCAVCHEAQAAVLNSDHDLRLTAPKSHNLAGKSPRQSGVCGACHQMHGGKPGEPVLQAWERHAYQGEEAALERDTLCLDCHRREGLADGAWVARFSHPARDLILRADPERMPLIDANGELGEFGAIGCITCHDPHRWTAPKKGNGLQAKKTPVRGLGNLSGNVLSRFLRRRKDRFCVDCHGIEAILKFKYYHDTRVRDGDVDYLK